MADPTDPWADDLPVAGWETARHGNYHQPGPDAPTDLHDCLASQTGCPEPGWDQMPPEIDGTDLAWLDQQPHPDTTAPDTTQPATPTDPADSDPRASLGDALPTAFPQRCGCGSTFDLRPLSTAELSACRTRVVLHMHVTDQTLIDRHGVLRTADGPITLDQLRRWLTDADANLTIRPVLDPAAVAAVDSYEIPLSVREAVHVRHPGSVWPYSPAATISIGGRIDLDHITPYDKDGPPGQTGPGTLGPLARSEHRPKTVGGWGARQPDTGTYLWRSPHGWIALTTNQGTLMLGDTPWARTVWTTARDSAQPASAG